MNCHAIEVEQVSERSLISGFHACFSLGGLAGAGISAFLMSVGLSAAVVLSCGAVVVAAFMMAVWPFLVPPRAAHRSGRLSLPRGIVVLLTVLVSITYLIEGAILDWRSLLVTTRHLVDITRGGFAFAFFSSGMTVGRLTGDGIGTRFGRANLLQCGGAVGFLGLVLMLGALSAPLALTGFAMVGLGTSNLIPILFSQAGRQRAMPPGMAIAAITTVSYGVTLIGPGLVGFLAAAIGLANAFRIFALLMLVVVAGGRVALRE